MTEPGTGQRGQATPLVLVVVLFAALVSVGIVRVATVTSHRASAQAAADAAALAGAADGQQAAVQTAHANRAELVSFHLEDLDAVVTVRRQGVTATARARWQPTAIP